MDRYWGEISIGGTITREMWRELKLGILQDTGENLSIPFPKLGKGRPEHLCFEENELPNGMFVKIEDTCVKYKIPYERRSGGEDPEYFVFSPKKTEDPYRSYSINVEHDLMTQAEELMELRDAIKEINILNAPTFVNDTRPVYKDYTKHLLSGKDLLGFMISTLDVYLPPNIPELPRFEVDGLTNIKTKKRKAK